MTGPRPRRTITVPLRAVAAVAVFVLVANLVGAWLLERQQDQLLRQQQQIRRNQQTIAVTQWDQCQIRNDGVQRQNNLLDAAVAAERRRPVPDPQRIVDLTRFKGNLADCGDEPPR